MDRYVLQLPITIQHFRCVEAFLEQVPIKSGTITNALEYIFHVLGLALQTNCKLDQLIKIGHNEMRGTSLTPEETKKVCTLIQILQPCTENEVFTLDGLERYCALLGYVQKKFDLSIFKLEELWIILRGIPDGTIRNVKIYEDQLAEILNLVVGASHTTQDQKIIEDLITSITVKISSIRQQ
jgi:hypothetical protein